MSCCDSSVIIVHSQNCVSGVRSELVGNLQAYNIRQHRYVNHHCMPKEGVKEV